MPPEAIAPAGAFLAHASCPLNGEILFVGTAHISRLAVIQTHGISAAPITAESIGERLDEIMDTADSQVVRGGPPPDLDSGQACLSKMATACRRVTAPGTGSPSCQSVPSATSAAVSALLRSIVAPPPELRDAGGACTRLAGAGRRHAHPAGRLESGHARPLLGDLRATIETDRHTRPAALLRRLLDRLVTDERRPVHVPPG
jgi:hypothetical protein